MTWSDATSPDGAAIVRSFRTGNVFEDVFAHFGRRQRGDPLFLEFQKFDVISRRLQAEGFPTLDELLAATIDHLVEVVDASATLLSTLASTDVSITIKMLQAPQESAVHQIAHVHTFMRNQLSRATREVYQTSRAIYKPVDWFPYSANTAFEEIPNKSGRLAYFLENNLQRRLAAGRYKNGNDDWKRLYNAAAVVAIPSVLQPNAGLLGYLCADARYGKLQPVLRPLEAIATHIYNVLGLLFLASEQETPRVISVDPDGMSNIDDSNELLARASWRVVSGTLQQNDESINQRFIQLMGKLETMYEHRYPITTGAPSGPVREGTSLRSASGDAEMTSSEQGWLGNEITDREWRRDSILRALQEHPVTEEESLAALEAVAETDSYAAQMLQRFRSRSIAAT